MPTSATTIIVNVHDKTSETSDFISSVCLSSHVKVIDQLKCLLNWEYYHDVSFAAERVDNTETPEMLGMEDEAHVFVAKTSVPYIEKALATLSATGVLHTHIADKLPKEENTSFEHEAELSEVRNTMKHEKKNKKEREAKGLRLNTSEMKGYDKIKARLQQLQSMKVKSQANKAMAHTKSVKAEIQKLIEFAKQRRPGAEEYNDVVPTLCCMTDLNLDLYLAGEYQIMNFVKSLQGLHDTDQRYDRFSGGKILDLFHRAEELFRANGFIVTNVQMGFTSSQGGDWEEYSDRDRWTTTHWELLISIGDVTPRGDMHTTSTRYRVQVNRLVQNPYMKDFEYKSNTPIGTNDTINMSFDGGDLEGVVCAQLNLTFNS